LDIVDASLSAAFSRFYCSVFYDTHVFFCGTSHCDEDAKGVRIKAVTTTFF
jgi:hypothetical protein